MFEGLALGLTNDYSSLVQFSVAITIHKGAESLAVGISLIKAFPASIHFNIGLIVLFSSFTPLGICFGIILSKGHNEIYEIIFASLAAGSFIYIACSEVIVQQFSQNQYKHIKFVSFILGVIFIVLIDVLSPPEEDCHICEEPKTKSLLSMIKAQK